VSALITGQGKIVPGKQLNLGDTGIIDGTIPELSNSTPFSKAGDIPFWLMIAISAFAARRSKAA